MLAYDDVLELLGYRESQRHPLEILGFEHSMRGRQQFKNERLDIEPSLLAAILHDVHHDGMFPRQYCVRPPQCGVFIEQRGDSFVLIDRDKPSIEARWIYDNAESAARALMQKTCDPAYLARPQVRDEFLSVEYSWQPPPEPLC